MTLLLTVVCFVVAGACLVVFLGVWAWSLANWLADRTEPGCRCDDCRGLAGWDDWDGEAA